MPSQDAGLSRRSLLQGAATAGVAGLAVTAMGAAAPALAATATASGTGGLVMIGLGISVAVTGRKD